MITYPLLTIIKIKSSLNILNEELFKNEYGFLVKDMKTSKSAVIFVYNNFITYRLYFSMIPLIFMNYPGLQIIFLNIITLIYICILLHLKPKINREEFKLDIVMQILFLVLQYHFYLFIDGGIVSGTANQVSETSMINFLDKADISFLIIALFAIFTYLGYVIYQLASKAVSVYNSKKRYQEKLKK